MMNLAKVLISGVCVGSFSLFTALPAHADPDAYILRLDASGNKDMTFGFGGLVPNKPGVETNDDIRKDADGKYVVCGTFTNNGRQQVIVARYKPDATPDTFGWGGAATAPWGADVSVAGCAIDGNGKIVVAAHNGNNILLVRFTAAGVLDSSFGVAGYSAFNTPSSSWIASDVQIGSGNKIYVSASTARLTPIIPGEPASDFVALRFTANGILDMTFDGDGVAQKNLGAHDVANAMAVDSSGRPVLVGYINPLGSGVGGMTIARLTTSGGLDSTFSGDGILVVGFPGWLQAENITIDGNGRYVLAGRGIGTVNPNTRVWDFAVARVNSEGTMDTTFGGSGLGIDLVDVEEYDSAHDVQIASDGKIVVSGIPQPGESTPSGSVPPTKVVVLRYHATGARDTTFGVQGTATVPFSPSVRSANLVMDGTKPVVVGDIR